MNVHLIVVSESKKKIPSSPNLIYLIFIFKLKDLESTNTKKETIRKKPIVKKKTNFIHHYPQSTHIINKNNSHSTPAPPPYNMNNCYQQPFYGQYSIPTSYSHVEHFQPSPPPTSQCEIADQELYFPMNYQSFRL
jgi:hypothetical protein